MSPIIFLDSENPNDCILPANISQQRIVDLLNQPLESNSPNSSSLKITLSEENQAELEIAFSGPDFDRPILAEGPVRVYLQWNDRFLYFYYTSGLNPIEFYANASGDESWLSKLVIPSPAWSWQNCLNSELFGTKLVVSNFGDDDAPEFQYVLSKEIFFERGLLERSFLAEIANFHDDLALFFDRIQEALDDWS